MKIRLVSVDSGDWVSLYLNDTLIHEGHNIPDHVWISVIGVIAPSVVVEEDEVAGEE